MQMKRMCSTLTHVQSFIIKALVRDTRSKIHRQEDFQETEIASVVENRATMLEIAGTTRRTAIQTEKNQATINNLTNIVYKPYVFCPGEPFHSGMSSQSAEMNGTIFIEIKVTPLMLGALSLCNSPSD